MLLCKEAWGGGLFEQDLSLPFASFNGPDKVPFLLDIVQISAKRVSDLRFIVEANTKAL